MMRTAMLVVGVLVAAACGGDGRDSSSGTTEAPAITEPTSPPSSPATTVVEPTVPPDTSVRPETSTTVVEPTVPTVPTVPTDEIVLGPPDPQLLSALPPEEIDWASVGSGWLLVDHPTGYGPFTDPPALDQRGLYLVAPDDRVYGVSALPTDGSWIAAVAGDGRQVLLQTYDPVCAEGCTCGVDPESTVETDEPDTGDLVQREYGYVLLDTVARTVRPVIEPVVSPVCTTGTSGGFHREVTFTRDGRGIWVSESWYADWGHVERVRLSRVDVETGAWVTIVDETVEGVDVAAATSPTLLEAGLVELGDGRIFVGVLDRIWHASADGAPIRDLSDTGTVCHPLGVWDDEHVLTRCAVPTESFSVPEDVWCRPTGLWLVAIDGSPAEPLAVRTFDGRLDCWGSYTNAIQLDDDLAVQVSGDGATDGVDIIASNGDVTPWMPPDIADSFTELLLGVRNGSWLLSASNEWGDAGVYEVTVEGSRRLDVPSGAIVVL